MHPDAVEGLAKSSVSFLNAVLTFIYSIAHIIGVGIIKLLGTIFPFAKFPAYLADPLGFLTVLTLFAVLLTMAKKVAWIVLAVGWGFILIRILMVIFGK